MQHRVSSPIADDIAPSRHSDGVPLVLGGTRDGRDVGKLLSANGHEEGVGEESVPPLLCLPLFAHPRVFGIVHELVQQTGRSLSCLASSARFLPQTTLVLCCESVKRTAKGDKCASEACPTRCSVDNCVPPWLKVVGQGLQSGPSAKKLARNLAVGIGQRRT